MTILARPASAQRCNSSLLSVSARNKDGGRSLKVALIKLDTDCPDPSGVTSDPESLLELVDQHQQIGWTRPRATGELDIEPVEHVAGEMEDTLDPERSGAQKIQASASPNSLWRIAATAWSRKMLVRIAELSNASSRPRALTGARRPRERIVGRREAGDRAPRCCRGKPSTSALLGSRPGRDSTTSGGP